MDDGRVYEVTHPDFAMVGDGAVMLASGPGHDLSGPAFVICYFEHIARMELLKSRRRRAA